MCAVARLFLPLCWGRWVSVTRAAQDYSNSISFATGVAPINPPAGTLFIRKPHRCRVAGSRVELAQSCTGRSSRRGARLARHSAARPIPLRAALPSAGHRPSKCAPASLISIGGAVSPYTSRRSNSILANRHGRCGRGSCDERHKDLAGPPGLRLPMLASIGRPELRVAR
jgi:hypothetical protein